jgi:hypothetical protein
MDREEDPRDLERQIAEASRIASRVGDQTTVQRLVAWIEDLRRKLEQHREPDVGEKRSERALGSFGSNPVGLKDEIWLQAESKINDERSS